MIFALLTLLTALALAAVAGWFSIVGVMAIYAGAPMHALVMGVVLEAGKLVTTSWLYRNWSYSGWRLKGPLIAFTLALMLATSIGVFGFLSKSHLEQGAKTIDNGPKVERIEQQIAREKAIIADNEKVIAQLDATINSYLGKDRADRSVVIRRSQAPQRKQLRDEIDAANKRIDTFSEEKFKLQSELRELELEVGPIRYIAELIYGAENNSTKNIEGAVKIFTLLIVSTLDPLAIILLVAANHSIMRRQNEKKKKTDQWTEGGPSSSNEQKITKDDKANIINSVASDAVISRIDEGSITKHQEATIHNSVLQESVENIDEEKKITVVASQEDKGIVLQSTDSDPLAIIREVLAEKPDTEAKVKIEAEIPKVDNEEKAPTMETLRPTKVSSPLAVIRSPNPSKVSTNHKVTGTVEAPVQATPPLETVPWIQQDAVIREIIGSTPHFIPQKINEEEKLAQVEESTSPSAPTPNSESEAQEATQISKEGQGTNQNEEEMEGTHISSPFVTERHKYPKALSWLREFTRT